MNSRAVVARARLVALVVALTSTACTRAGDAPGAAASGGTLAVAMRSLPDVLLPPLAIALESRQANDLLYDRLAVLTAGGSPFGDAGFTPRIAASWTWSADSLRVTFALDPKARWHDGTPLRASDIAFSFDFYRDPAVASPRASDLSNVDSVTVDGDHRASVWFRARTPLQFHDVVMNLVPIPAHIWRDRPRAMLAADSLVRHPVGSGPFRFREIVANQQVVLEADSTHPLGRPLLDRVVLRVAPDDATNITRLLGNEVDVMMDVRSEEQLDRLMRDSTIHTELVPGFSYGFVQFNLRAPRGTSPHAILGDRSVRRALAMGTNRDVLTRSVFGRLGSVAFGPFVRAQFIADTTVPQIAFDPAAARRTLDSLGWTVGRDGVRARNGRAFELTALLPASPPMVALGTLLQAQWREIGVTLRLQPVDFAAFTARAIERRDFDVAISRLSTTQSYASLPGSWGTQGASPGGRNIGAYMGAEFDAHVDSALASSAADRARAHLRAAFTAIVADAPAIFVFEGRGAYALRTRVITPPLRADAWWLDIPAWSIAPSQRLARDATVAAR